MKADREAMKEGAYFPRLDPLGFVNPTKEEMQTGLKALQTGHKGESIVVYLATYGLVDEKGAVQLIARDSDLDHFDTLLPLSEALESFAGCPSRTKLLVLDIARPLNLPGPVGLGDDVADRLTEAVKAWKPEDAKDGRSLGMVLVSCSPGQRSFGTETLGESAFNHFLRAGLAGEADTSGNKRVSARELAEYLERMVDAWAVTNLGVHQKPVLLTSGTDFDLIATGTVKKPLPHRGVALAKKDKTKEQPKEKEKEKEKGKEAGKDKDAAQAGEPEYPGWLAEGWNERERWSRSHDFLTAPRAFRMLEIALLRAEQEWRGGAELAELRARFESRLRALGAERKKTRPEPPNPFRSIGQAIEFGGWSPDTGLVTELDRLITANRRQSPTLKPAVPAFLAKLNEKPDPVLDLAGTIVSATRDERPDALTVVFLGKLLAESNLANYDRLVETRFLRDLAARLEQGPKPASSVEEDQRDEAIRQAWGMITLAEQANNRPDALAWVREVLVEAEARRNLGEVLLQADSAGFATWEKIGNVCKEAREGDGYAFVYDTEETIRHAQIMVRRSLVVLKAYQPYLDSVSRTDLEDVWFKAARATQDLLPMLQPPQPGAGGQGVTPETLRARSGDLRAATDALEERLDDLQGPFSKEEVASLVKRSEADKADPQVIREIDTLLLTPFLASSDRQALWSAGRRLAERLAANPLPPRPEDVPVAAGPGLSGPSSTLGRSVRLATLLALAGEDVGSLQEKLTALEGRPTTEVEKERPEFFKPLAKAWTSLLGKVRKPTLADDLDRPGAIAPIFADWQTNPISARLERERLAHRAWLVDHYLHVGRDQHDLDKFYQAAAIETAAGELPTEVYAAFRTEGTAETAPLTSENPATSRTLLVELHDPEAPQAQVVSLKVIATGDNRLSVKPESIEVKPTRTRPARATFQVEWNEGDGVARTAPAGFLLEARLKNGRNYHVRVPLTILAKNERLQLVLSDDPKKPTVLPIDKLRLRTLPGRQLYYLYINNPSATARDVRVEILKGDTQSLETLETIKLSAKEHATTKVPSFGPSAVKPGAPLPDLDGPLTFRIVDDKTQNILDAQRLQVEIASADDLVGEIKARFEPQRPGEQNKLSVVLEPGPALVAGSSPCQVELVLSPKYFPRVEGPPRGAAALSGELRAGAPLALFATDIPLNSTSPDEKGYFQLDIDGQKRARWFEANFPLGGPTQWPSEKRTPRLRFVAEPKVERGKPTRLETQFEVDGAPSDALIHYRLLRGAGSAGRALIREWTLTAKNRHLGFDARGENAALQFEASQADWQPVEELPSIRGNFTLEATLYDKSNPKLVVARPQPLFIDDQAPTEITIHLPEGVVQKGTPTLKVEASVKPPESGIQSAEFFVGLKNDFGKVPTVAGRPVDGDPRRWGATLDISKAAGNPITLSVRFVSKAGLAEIGSADLTLTEPPPAANAAGGPGANKPTVGSIAGKVFQTELAQPDRTVYLYEATSNGLVPVKSATSAADGSYSFADLKPGTYQVISRNPAYDTLGRTTVVVEAGKKATANIDLVR
jgi:hypothetical protein